MWHHLSSTGLAAWREAKESCFCAYGLGVWSISPIFSTFYMGKLEGSCLQKHKTKFFAVHFISQSSLFRMLLFWLGDQNRANVTDQKRQTSRMKAVTSKMSSHLSQSCHQPFSPAGSVQKASWLERETSYVCLSRPPVFTFSSLPFHLDITSPCLTTMLIPC